MSINNLSDHIYNSNNINNNNHINSYELSSAAIMSSVAKSTDLTNKFQTTESIDFWDSITDERVNEYYLLKGGPTIILSIVTIYLYFVLYLGPRLMDKHESFKLNKLLLIYNLGMALTNLWIFIQGLWVSNYGLDTLGCKKFGGDIKLSPKRGIYLGYLFFLTKLIELLDTIFFILRKKKKQITFLHVFHHSFVPIFVWAGLKLAPGGPNGFFPLINSLIHVIMYFYYGLSTFGSWIQPYLWWKRYLTRLQMIQFVLVVLNSIMTSLSKDCKFPILFSYLQGIVATVFLILFAMFYRNAYIEKKKLKINKKKSSTTNEIGDNLSKSNINNNNNLFKKEKNGQTSEILINNNNNNDNEEINNVSKNRTKMVANTKLL